MATKTNESKLYYLDTTVEREHMCFFFSNMKSRITYLIATIDETEPRDKER